MLQIRDSSAVSETVLPLTTEISSLSKNVAQTAHLLFNRSQPEGSMPIGYPS